MLVSARIAPRELQSSRVGRKEKKIPYASGEGLDLLGARASPEASERAATP